MVTTRVKVATVVAAMAASALGAAAVPLSARVS